MQSKNENTSPISNIIATSLYAARGVINISNASKHLFFPTTEESNLSFTNRAQHEFKQKTLTVAEDLTTILFLK
ncbi:hypothetical protein [Legionella parisiensis]|uniref:Uncharacterized protein n=1 Tax=Legionella parisiensis TaxID=45071 RepID=A0A1E5JLR0_9GAMM|nr:hypothetical protein [Legionella parisiensis]KTD41639.1 hypothetical protein Lpar_2956 [Legionella parisiensis]OEH45444.1 hypothetical protein lpari_03628 [Legionella parisiensis]STX76043.1 Uncharacterised protein [Legionella parisiensis]